jgi:hypothetical protein
MTFDLPLSQIPHKGLKCRPLQLQKLGGDSEAGVSADVVETMDKTSLANISNLV